MLSEKHTKCVDAIRAALMTNPPQPMWGRDPAGKIGSPPDSSSIDKVVTQCRIVNQSKKDFKSVLHKVEWQKALPKKKEIYELLFKLVCPPGESKHAEGYALDIKGPTDNWDKDCAVTANICSALGASWVYPEKPHTHVEFASGVKPLGIGKVVPVATFVSPAKEAPQKQEKAATHADVAK